MARSTRPRPSPPTCRRARRCWPANAQGLPIPGFDLGNSPGDFTAEVCAGKTLVMTTTNGTRAILASLEAERVYIASFANLAATADEMSVQFLKKDHGHPIHIVCAGTEGFISLEDSLLAGALASQIAGAESRAAIPRPLVFGNDEALHRGVRSGWKWSDSSSIARSAKLLSLGRGGQNVLRIGLGRRHRGCRGQFDRFDLVAELSQAVTRCESWLFDTRESDGQSLGRALPRSCPLER